jgi:hypothetical protein
MKALVRSAKAASREIIPRLRSRPMGDVDLMRWLRKAADSAICEYIMPARWGSAVDAGRESH